jgi:L-malate glycosyltransferase
MKILFVIDGLFPCNGGAEKQAMTLAKHFKTEGHDIQILCPQLDETMPLCETLSGIKVTRIPYPKIKVFGSLLLYIKYMYQLYAMRKEYSVIHVHMVKNIAAFTGLMKVFLKFKYVAKVSGAWEFSSGVLDPEKFNKGIMLVRNYFIKKADHIQCVSSKTKQILLDCNYPEKIALLLPNGVDLTSHKLKVPHNDNKSDITIVYAGRLEYVKGVDILINAVNKLEFKVSLVIVGSGKEEKAFKKLCHDLDLESQVQFLGYITNLPEILLSADLYVQPSREEGLPNSVLEAMATGLPIVATNVSGNQDLVADGINGYLTSPEDIEDMSYKISKILSSSELLKTMGMNSRKIIEENYSIQSTYQQLLKVYQ